MDGPSKPRALNCLLVALAIMVLRPLRRGAVLLAIAALACAVPAAGQPAEFCSVSPELRSSLQQIQRAAADSRLAEFFRLHARTLPRLSRECHFPAQRSREILAPLVIALYSLGRLGDVDEITAAALQRSANDAEASGFRLRLLALRIDTAIRRRDGPEIETRYQAYERERAGRPDPAGLARDLDWVRRCRARGVVHLACRGEETTALYGAFSYENGASGGPRLEGQCPVDQPALTEEMIGLNGPFRIIERPGRALNAACRRERTIAGLADRWWTAVERGDGAAMAHAAPLLRELDAWAEDIDGFDRDNPVSRLQVRGLAYFVRQTDRRMRCGRCLAWRREELAAWERERTALRPYIEAAIPAILRGEDGFLRTDTVGLAGYLVGQAPSMGSERQAETIWLLIGASMQNRPAGAARSFEEVRNRLSEREALITALHPIDSTGVILVAGRNGAIILRELDTAATLAGRVGSLLLDAAARSPAGNADFPLRGAQLLYQQYVCPVETLGSSGARPTTLVFVPDSAMERVPLSLLVRPTGGCMNPAVAAGDAYRATPATALVDARWIGEDYAFRIMPFTPVGRAPATGAAAGYIGVGGARPGSAMASVEASAAPASPLRQQSEFAAAMPPLAGSLRELEATARLLDFPDPVLLSGENATEASVRSQAAHPRRILHFATHALDPASDKLVLEPLLVLTRPSRGPFDPENDGVLTRSEVSRLNIPGTIVLLSACRTAAPMPGLGAGLFSGLVQAFFEAGAEQAMATYWAVDDQSAATLVPEIARRLQQGQPTWDAVREAQREFRRRNAGERARWRHPFYWAAFVAVWPNSGQAPAR